MTPVRFVATIGLVCAAALSQPVAAADQYRKLSPNELRQRVKGMEITDDAHFSEQYMPDGMVRIVTMGRRIIGKWVVKQELLCTEMPKPDDARCAEVWVHGDRAQLRVPGDSVPFDVLIQKQTDRGWK